MKDKQIANANALLVLTLFLNHYIAFHGFIPSPLFWLMYFASNQSFISVILLLLLGISISVAIYSYTKISLRLLIIGLSSSSLYILINSFYQYFENSDYIEISLVTSIPFGAMLLLMLNNLIKLEKANSRNL